MRGVTAACRVEFIWSGLEGITSLVGKTRETEREWNERDGLGVSRGSRRIMIVSLEKVCERVGFGKKKRSEDINEGYVWMFAE